MSKKILNEITNDDLGFYDPTQDKINKRNLSDTRKSKLTLRMINRLKKIRATKEIEMAQNEELLGIMYGQEEDEGGPGAGT